MTPAQMTQRGGGRYKVDADSCRQLQQQTFEYKLSLLSSFSAFGAVLCRDAETWKAWQQRERGLLGGTLSAGGMHGLYLDAKGDLARYVLRVLGTQPQGGQGQSQRQGQSQGQGVAKALAGLPVTKGLTFAPSTPSSALRKPQWKKGTPKRAARSSEGAK